MEKIEVMYNNEKTEIIKNRLFSLEYFCKYFFHDKIINIQDDYSIEDFLRLVRFLEHGETPKNKDSIINVYKMLKKWGCHPALLSSLELSLKTTNKNHIIRRNRKVYHINDEMMKIFSKKYANYVDFDQNIIFETIDSFNDHDFEEFLDHIHHMSLFPLSDKPLSIIEIAFDWQCYEISDTISDGFGLMMPKILNRINDGSNLQIEEIESFLSEKFEYILDFPSFYKLPISTHIRTLEKIKSNYSVDFWLKYLQNIFQEYGQSAYDILVSLRSLESMTISNAQSIIELLPKNDSIVNQYHSIIISRLNDLEIKNLKLEQSNAELEKNMNILTQKVLNLEAANSSLIIENQNTIKRYEDLLSESEKNYNSEISKCKKRNSQFMDSQSKANDEKTKRLIEQDQKIHHYSLDVMFLEEEISFYNLRLNENSDKSNINIFARSFFGNTNDIVKYISNGKNVNCKDNIPSIFINSQTFLWKNTPALGFI